MPILKSRPRVRVRVPNEILPGSTFPAMVLLDCKKAVDVDFVRVSLRGSEKWVFGAGDGAERRAQEFLSLAAELCGERTIGPGLVEFPVHFPVAADTPPSFSGRYASIEYELRVQVSVPWWPDRFAEFEIHIAPPKVQSPKTENAIYASSTHGLVGARPYVELGLASKWARAGGVVSGVFALENVAYNRYSDVRVGLLGYEVLYGGRVRRELEYLRYQVHLGVEEAQDGERIPFRFRLPDEAMSDLAPATRPSGSPALVSVYWELELVVGVRWAADLVLRTPFSVLPRSPRPGDAPARLAPPTVGSDRLRELWSTVGERHGLRYDAQALTARRGATQLLVVRDHAGRAGVHLLAEMRYPPLHLDLEVRPATAMQKAVGGGVRVNAPVWDRDHWVSARDSQQAASVLAELVPILGPAQVRRMDDESCIVAVRDAGTNVRRLEAFVAASVQLADEVERLRNDLPPPTGLEAALPVWRDVARRMGASLETARLRIQGRVGELAVGIRMAFDAEGVPTWTWVSVESNSPIDTSHHGRWTSDAGVEAFVERFDGEAAQLAKVVATDATEVHIEGERIALRLEGRMGMPGGPTGEQVEQRVGRIARFVTLLRGAQGPYR